jgi:hypothetical protein
MSMVRIFLVTFNNVVEADTPFSFFSETAKLQEKFFIFGLIIWGTSVDNSVNPKIILVCCELYICLSSLFIAFYYLARQVFDSNYSAMI